MITVFHRLVETVKPAKPERSLAESFSVGDDDPCSKADDETRGEERTPEIPCAEAAEADHHDEGKQHDSAGVPTTQVRKPRSYSLPAMLTSRLQEAAMEVHHKWVHLFDESNEKEPDMEAVEEEEQPDPNKLDSKPSNDCDIECQSENLRNAEEVSSEAPYHKARSKSERLFLEEELVFPRLLGGTATEVLPDARYSPTLVPKLEACLPRRFRGYDWKLLYSLAQHGSSLHTLLRLVRQQSPTLIVVETAAGEVFGGFAATPWHLSLSYYGIGESFVFTCQPRFEQFTWSRSNSMFMFSNDHTIAMGGGGDFAWVLNSDLSSGTSGVSDTFSNRRLTSTPHFNIVNVEVWGFVTKK